MEPPVVDELRVFPSLDALTTAAAAHLADRASESVRQHGRYRLVLSGGHTPEGLYALLASQYRRSFPWRLTEIYFGDERCVSPRSTLSNYAMARTTLLDRVPVPRIRVHRMCGELRPPSIAAQQYARELHRSSGSEPAPEGQFDTVLLGVGPDGHTASLFPGSPALRERDRWVVSVRTAGRPPHVPRLTLTFPAIARSREVLFLIAGADKAAAMARIWSARPRGNDRYPASRVRSMGPIRWFLDAAAAAHLPQ